MTDKPIGHGTVLAGRFRLEDLVQETDGASFWRAIDQTLARNVAVNVLETSDPRSDALLVAARTSATITEGHFLRVLDAAQEDGVVYVVHEWGTGMSLDRMLAEGPLSARRAAWLVKEVADAITVAHSHGIAHGRLVPENVMVTDTGSVKLIGFVVDAVLHGRSQSATQDGRTLSDHESDVYNLAGLLYASLVARWPCTQDSLLPEAPRAHDRTMRPRQVRAGVPRELDAVCDRVLNPAAPHESLETAHDISAALSDFIGDPTAAPVHEPTAVIDRDELASFEAAPESAPTTEGGARSGSGAAGAAAAAGAGAAVGGAHAAAAPDEVGSTPGRTDEETRESRPASDAPAARAGDPDATQASAPAFEDEPKGRSRRSAPPPPPPLPEPEPKPLFAPGPPRATAERYPTSGGGATTGPSPAFGSSHGTGSLPPVWGPDSDRDVEDEGDWPRRDAGRDWLKLAAALGVFAILVMAVIFAFNLGRDSGGGGAPEADESPSSGESQSATGPLSITAVSDLDPPPSGNGEENGELAPLAIDGDPSTAWQTMTYYGNPKFGLLKDGVGLVLDLGGEKAVSDVQVTLQGGATGLEILAAPSGSGKPADVDSLQKVAASNGAQGRTDLPLNKSVTTRYLVVWLTSLPPGSGGFKGYVSEIVVKG